MDKLLLLAPPGIEPDREAVEALWREFQGAEIEVHVASWVTPHPIAACYLEVILIAGTSYFLTKVADHYVDKLLDLIDATVGSQVTTIDASIRKGDISTHISLRRHREGDLAAILEALRDLEEQDKAAERKAP